MAGGLWWKRPRGPRVAQVIAASNCPTIQFPKEDAPACDDTGIRRYVQIGWAVGPDQTVGPLARGRCMQNRYPALQAGLGKWMDLRPRRNGRSVCPWGVGADVGPAMCARSFGTPRPFAIAFQPVLRCRIGVGRCGLSPECNGADFRVICCDGQRMNICHEGIGRIRKIRISAPIFPILRRALLIS